MEETVRFIAVRELAQMLLTYREIIDLFVHTQFCCWENWPFSMIVINELLLEVRMFVYTPYLTGYYHNTMYRIPITHHHIKCPDYSNILISLF